MPPSVNIHIEEADSQQESLNSRLVPKARCNFEGMPSWRQMLGKLTEPEPYFLMQAAWLILQQTGSSGRSGMSLRPHMAMRTPSRKCFALVDLCLHPFLRRTTIQGCQDPMCSPQQVHICFSSSCLAFAISDLPSQSYFEITAGAL